MHFVRYSFLWSTQVCMESLGRFRRTLLGNPRVAGLDEFVWVGMGEVDNAYANWASEGAEEQHTTQTTHASKLASAPARKQIDRRALKPRLTQFGCKWCYKTTLNKMSRFNRLNTYYTVRSYVFQRAWRHMFLFRRSRNNNNNRWRRRATYRGRKRAAATAGSQRGKRSITAVALPRIQSKPDAYQRLLWHEMLRTNLCIFMSGWRYFAPKTLWLLHEGPRGRKWVLRGNLSWNDEIIYLSYG